LWSTSDDRTSATSPSTISPARPDHLVAGRAQDRGDVASGRSARRETRFLKIRDTPVTRENGSSREP
jgi:hypothetical protein